MSDHRTRHLVDPGLLPLLDQMPPYELTLEMIPHVREGFGDRLNLVEDPDAVARVDTLSRKVPGRTGDPDVAVVVHRPCDPSGLSGAILHIHGGGYIAGDASSMAPAHRIMAWALGCVIVSVDYRLAPETAAPGSVEDCYAALAWLMVEADALGVDRTRIGVMGESAGGGLAAALALLARDRGEYEVAFQHLIYPMLDDRTCTTTDPNEFSGEYVWTPHSNHLGWSCLLGHEPGLADVSPYAAPARATDLAGLPPTYIAVGALDLFIDEDLDFARRLIRAGVPTELHVYQGVFHGFHFDPAAAATIKANGDSGAALARALAPRP